MRCLGAVLDDGLDAVEAACREALEAGPCGCDVVLNILARRRVDTANAGGGAAALRLSVEPAADCARYDASAPCPGGWPWSGHELLEMMAELSLSGMRTVYDEIMRDGLRRQHAAQQILGDLLAAEVAEKKARSIRYQLGPPGCRWPGP